MTDTSTAPPPQPLTPQEAELLAAKMVGEYLTACHINDPARAGDYLMKLCSVAGVVMARFEGSAQAFARLQDTALFILDTMPAERSGMYPVQ